MLRVLAPFSALFLSAAFLLAGFGLQGTLVPVRANIEGFSASAIGFIGSGYYLGFAMGCILGPYFIARVGHIRSFAAFAVMAAITVLLFELVRSEYFWIIWRVGNGIAMSGLYMIIESWLNERSDTADRSKVFSVYTVINLTVVTVGQMLMVTADPSSGTLFSIVAILICLGVLPVTLTTAIAPAPIEPANLNIRALYRLSPAGVIGCFCVGLANSVFWSLGPVYALDAGLTTSGVAVFVSLAAVGGALLQWPLGRLSDRVDRRQVIVMCCGAATIGGIGIALSGQLPVLLIYLFAFAFGGFAIPIYALSVAHTNDYVEDGNFVAVSGGLLLVFGIGAIIGPFVASQMAQYWGPSMLFFFTAAVHIVTGLVIALRIRVHDAIPAAERVDFVVVPNSSPTIFTMDPRSDEENQNE